MRFPRGRPPMRNSRVAVVLAVTVSVAVSLAAPAGVAALSLAPPVGIGPGRCLGAGYNPSAAARPAVVGPKRWGFRDSGRLWAGSEDPGNPDGFEEPSVPGARKSSKSNGNDIDNDNAKKNRERATQDRLQRRNQRKQHRQRQERPPQPLRTQGPPSEKGTRRSGTGGWKEGIEGPIPSTGGRRSRAEKRRRRRDDQRRNRPTSSDALAEAVAMGTRATGILGRKTGRLWRDLAEATAAAAEESYGEGATGGYYPESNSGSGSNRRNGRRTGSKRSGRTRRSGFNWPVPPGEGGTTARGRRRNRSGEASYGAEGDSLGYGTAGLANDENENENEVTTVEYYYESDVPAAPPERNPPRSGRNHPFPTRPARAEARVVAEAKASGPMPEPASETGIPKREPSPGEPPVGRTADGAAAPVAGAPATPAQVLRAMPLGRLLEALDEKDVAYSPRASRRDLEELLLGLQGDDLSPDPATQPGTGTLPHGQERGGSNGRSSDEPFVSAVKKTNTPTENARGDEIVVEVESISPEEWKRRRGRNEDPRGQPATEDRRARPTPGRGGEAGGNAGKRKPGRGPPSPGAGTGGRRRTEQRPPPVDSSPKDRPGRRVYSPWSGGRKKAGEDAGASGTSRGRSHGDPAVNKRQRRTTKKEHGARGTRKKANDDDFDRFGDFVEGDLERFGDFLAESVDNIFWGTTSEETTADGETNHHAAQARRSARGDPAEASAPRARAQGRRERNRGFASERNSGDQPPKTESRRHWKDKAEERLDRAMGLHGTGGNSGSYDRWTKKQRRNPRGRRAWAGRSPRRFQRERPFWEEEGSLFSVLFGDGPSPFFTGLDEVLGSTTGGGGRNAGGRTLSVLLKNCAVVLAGVAGSLCRWASVHDTLPRPLVFLGATAAGLLSGPGGRIRGVFLALLSARVLGEWLYDGGEGDAEGFLSREARGKDGGGDGPCDEDDDGDDKGLPGA